MAVQFCAPDSNSDLSSIMDLIEGGTDVLVLDSRKREIFHREGSYAVRKVYVQDALRDLRDWHRKLWRMGSTEEHLAATLAFFYNVISQRTVKRDVLKDHQQEHLH